MPKLLPRSDINMIVDPFPGVDRGRGARITVRGTYIDPAKVRDTLMRLAADVVKAQRPKWTRNARQLAIADGWFESYLGGAGSFAPDGVPSWNWGAVAARPGMKFILHGDHKADGTAFVGHYAAFANMADGFVFWDKIMPDTAIEAAQTGDAYKMAEQMFKAGYYSNVDKAPLGNPEGDKRRIQGYANALVNTSRVVAKALGEPTDLVTGAAGSHGYLAPTLEDSPTLTDGQESGTSLESDSGSLAAGVVAAGAVGGAVILGKKVFSK